MGPLPSNLSFHAVKLGRAADEWKGKSPAGNAGKKKGPDVAVRAMEVLGEDA
jgi:hypothetical protein